ncbi:MAG: PD40 domain-containing protein [Fimbriimonadaceae bacterium]|nr:PD40 domain-containing protein [Fimbriimonadaceae bacterium]
MQKKIATRAVIILFVIAAMFAGYRIFADWAKDPNDKGYVPTHDLILALEDTENGTQAVIFTLDGVKKVVPGDWTEKEVKEATWRSDGNRVMFVGNRDDEAFQIYRWNPQSGAVDRRMPAGSRNVSFLWYHQGGEEAGNERGLAIVGGLVYQYEQGGSIRLSQLLPPRTVGPTVTESEGATGASDAMTGPYKALGESFTDAAWAAGGNVVYAVMRRQTGGQILISQQIGVDDKGSPLPPVPMMAADRIELHVNAAGDAAFSFTGFQWPDPANIPDEFRKNGEVTVPYTNGLFLVKWNAATNQPQMIPVFLTEKNEAVRSPHLSADSQAIVAQYGTIEEEQFKGQSLILVPAAEGGIQQVQAIGPASMINPAFAPDSSKIVCIGKDDQGRTRIYLIGQGQPPRAIGDPGDYREPIFSPQVKESAAP